MKTLGLSILFILISFRSYAALEISCTASANSCNAYLCMEGTNHCGIKGYYLGYAYKYCDRFSKKQSKFSAVGRQWMRETRTCLQENTLASVDSGKSCKQIKKSAFKGHVPCYIDAGFCELPFRDKFRVMKIIYGAILRPSIILPGFKIMKKCYFSKGKHNSFDHYDLLRESGIKEDFFR